MIGQTISHYHIVEELGAGAMGVVYKAEDMRLGRFVALKFLPDTVAKGPQALSRFQREAKAASALNHPNICTIYEIDEADGRTFIAMELLEGETLRHRISGKPLEIETVLDLAIEIADALDASHAKGIIHRDIKPANIFVTNSGHAKILDFGVAKVCQAEARHEPRTMRRKRTHHSGDRAGNRSLYVSRASAGRGIGRSHGPVLVRRRSLPDGYGQAPLSRAKFRRHHRSHPQPRPVAPMQVNPDIPSSLQEVIQKALEKDRSLRYQHAADMRADLKQLKRDMESGARVGGSGTGPVPDADSISFVLRQRQWAGTPPGKPPPCATSECPRSLIRWQFCPSQIPVAILNTNTSATASPEA